MIFFVVAIVLSILAPIVARFVQLAVNRQREYLADASSVELTRNPYGLERALAKISADPEVLEVANRATQHMYFTNPIKKFEERSKGLFSTHPATVDRINRLRELTGEKPLEPAEVAQLAGARVGDRRGAEAAARPDLLRDSRRAPRLVRREPRDGERAVARLVQEGDRPAQRDSGRKPSTRRSVSAGSTPSATRSTPSGPPSDSRRGGRAATGAPSTSPRSRS